MSAKNYVESASTLSVAVITLTAFALVMATTDMDRLAHFDAAHRAFCRWYTARHFERRLAQKEQSPVVLTNFVVGIGTVALKFQPPDKESALDEGGDRALSSLEEGSPTTVKAVLSVSDSSDDWAVVDAFTLQRSLPDGAGDATRVAVSGYDDPPATPRVPDDILRSVEVEMGIDPPPPTPDADTSFLRRFTKVHGKLADAKVKVPLLDVEVDPNLAAWVVLGAILLLLVLIRARLRPALRDPGALAEEPYFLVESKTRLERLVSLAWGIGIVLAPAAATFAVVGVVAVGNAAGGPVATAGWTLWTSLQFAFIVGLMLMGTWLSLVIVGQVLQLRRMLREARQ